MNHLLGLLKENLKKAMKHEVEMRKINQINGDSYDMTIATKEVARSIISMFPEIGVKPEKATDEQTIQLLKKYIFIEKTRELYIQKYFNEEKIKGLTNKELNKLTKETINILGDKLINVKINIAQSYLPKEITEDKIIDWITDNINFNKLKNNMQAIGIVKKHFGGAVNPLLVKNIVECWFK